LQSPDPAKRVQAAQSVFKTHDESMLPAIDSALAKETNKDARLAFSEARAAILLFKEDATDPRKWRRSPPSGRAAIRKPWRC